MKRRHEILLLLPIAFLLASCPMPTGLAPSAGLVTVPSPAQPAPFAVENDGARGIAVFVDGEGSRVDVAATDEDGSTVACVDALGSAVLSDENGAKGLARHPVIVAGARADGKPGVWIVMPDNTIQAVTDELTGAVSSCLPESDEKEGTFRGRFGWVYHIMGISEDGRFIAGYAENPRGFSRGRWKIEAGTTVGVYWRVWKHPARPFWVVSHARIIGTWQPAWPPAAARRGHPARHRIHPRLEQLKWFFLGYLSDYLVMVDKDGVHRDTGADAYLVTGTDQDGEAAVATIDGRGKVSIEPVSTPSDEVDLSPTALAVSPTALADGGSGLASVTVANLAAGNESAEFSVDFYMALTGAFAPGSDTRVGSAAWSSGVPGGSSVTVAGQIAIPEDLAINQDVYIYAVVDAGAAVAETDETNNTSAAPAAGVLLLYDDEQAAPRSYPVRIATYPPTGSGSTDTVMALYRDTGTGTAVSYVDSDMSGGSDYSVLDFTAGGLGSGKYYVMVASWSGRNGPYAFSVRTDSIALRTFANLASNSVDPGEPDDQPKVTAVAANTTVPSTPVGIGVGEAMNRYSAAGDWDWFTFTLP